MKTDLHKRLEEAGVTIRTEIINEIPHAWLSTAIDKATRQGFELGYKEAIAQAKEWIAIKGIFNGKTCGDLKQYIADFETYMNKLWEEKK